MISNSDTFYAKCKRFQDERKKVMDAYEGRMTAIADTKGSKFFVDESKKAEATRDEALAALKAEYIPGFDTILQGMRDANARRGVKPPTEDELRLVQALKMRDKVTEAELDRIANSLKSSEVCLAVVNEVATANGIMRNYMSYCDTGEMPVSAVDDAIKNITLVMRNFIEYDTNDAARRSREYHERRYGTTGNEPPLPKRALFDDKAGCYREIAGLEGKELAAFCAAVDN